MDFLTQLIEKLHVAFEVPSLEQQRKSLESTFDTCVDVCFKDKWDEFKKERMSPDEYVRYPLVNIYSGKQVGWTYFDKQGRLLYREYFK